MKKSQITLFVVLGIVIIIIVGLLTYYYGSVKKQKPFVNLFEDNENDKIDQQFRECLRIISGPIIDRAIGQGGYFEEEGIPINHVYENGYYTTSYDSHYPGYGISNKNDLKIYLEEQVNNEYWGCMKALHEDLSRKGINWYMELYYLDVTIYDGQIIISYEYDVDMQNITRNVETTETIATNVGYFLNRAEYLTTTYIYSIGDVDTSLNYQICQELNNKYGVRPSYYTDFFKSLAGNPDITLQASHNFFIIKITKDEDVFAFAIRPETDINLPIC